MFNPSLIVPMMSPSKDHKDGQFEQETRGDNRIIRFQSLATQRFRDPPFPLLSPIRESVFVTFVYWGLYPFAAAQSVSRVYAAASSNMIAP